MQMRVLAILRAEQFSPRSVDKDRAIMAAVSSRLRAAGHEVTTVSESRLHADGSDETQRPADRSSESHQATTGNYDLVLSMGRLPQTLAWLQQLTVPVVNAPEGVVRCRRSTAERFMAEAGVPLPPRRGPHGCWLKRADAAAQSAGDVVYCADDAALQSAICRFRMRGINDYTVSAHVEGDVVKFYGVAPPPSAADSTEATPGFFRYYYPTDDGDTKFGNEDRNGPAHHYTFSTEALQQAAEHLAATIGIKVYGGDCIIRPDGTFCMIDFNDWPSFSRCRDEAAEAIASLVMS